MNGSRERLAWAILLSSLFACIGLTVSVPLAVSATVNAATRPLTIVVQRNRGTVIVFQNGAASHVLIAGDAPVDLNPEGAIRTNAPADTALMLVHASQNDELLARVQIYGNTNVHINRATSPRFEASSQEKALFLNLTHGRLHLTLLPNEGRPFLLKVMTPQGTVSLQEPGQYAVSVSGEISEVVVQRGQAMVTAQEQTLLLQADERAEIESGLSPFGPLVTERNLIKNGDFRNGYAEWVLRTWRTELAEEPTGKTELVEVEGEPALRFERIGRGHADAAIRQNINQDVTDFETLHLVINMRLVHHSLEVCGIQGSECPLIVQIEYDDVNSIRQTWQQGFYAVGEISHDRTPDICLYCGHQNPHQQVSLGQLIWYESDNLMEALSLQGILPRHINTIILVGSGHSFQTEIIDVALVAKE